MTDEYEEINHPDHYLGDRKYETIDVIDDWDLNFNVGTAVKHISRAGRKPGHDTVKDYLKAQFYLGYEIDRLMADGAVEREIAEAEAAAEAAAERAQAKRSQVRRRR